MVIVVQPKTQAELNQLISILDSKGVSFQWKGNFGDYFHIFPKHLNVVNPHPKHVLSQYPITPVNELYAKLN